MSEFSRGTVIEALRALEIYSNHADVSRFLLKFGLEKEAPENLGSKTKRINALISYLINNPNKKGPLGSDLSFEIIENIIEYHQPHYKKPYIILDGYEPPSLEDQLPDFVNSLKRDGYIIQNGKLKKMLPDAVHLPEKEDELTYLLNKFEFDIAKGHLEQAISAHTRGQWASANGQLRSFIESLFDSILRKIDSNSTQTGYNAFEKLAILPSPFLLTESNEWKKGNNGCGFLHGFWNMLHPNGSHPGLSDKEESTFRLQFVILTASHYLKRLDRRIK